MEVLDEIIKNIDTDKVIIGGNRLEFKGVNAVCYYEMLSNNERILDYLLADSLALLQCKRNTKQIDDISMRDVIPVDIRPYCFDEGTDLSLYMKRQVLEIVIPYLTHGFIVQFVLGQFESLKFCSFIVYGVDVRAKKVYGRVLKAKQDCKEYTLTFDDFTEIVKKNIENPVFNVMAFRLSPNYEKDRNKQLLLKTIEYSLDNVFDDEIVYGIGVYDVLNSCINDNLSFESFRAQIGLLKILQQHCELLIKSVYVLKNDMKLNCNWEEMAKSVQDKTTQLNLMISLQNSDYKIIRCIISEIKDAEERLLLDIKKHLL